MSKTSDQIAALDDLLRFHADASPTRSPLKPETLPRVRELHDRLARTHAAQVAAGKRHGQPKIHKSASARTQAWRERKKLKQDGSVKH